MTKGLVIRMKRVLICDDAAFMRLSIMKMLKGNGYDVAGEASNGDEAIEQYKILNPDIVLMDITMPGLDGISAVKAIKEYDPNAIIIMCSAMGQYEKIMEAIQAVAKDFVVKPFEEPRLIAALKKWSE